MVKKVFALILCFVYAAVSSGATVNFHYCMGKFTGIDFKSSANSKCSNCGMEKEQKKGCCNDKHNTLQLKKDQLLSTINVVSNNQFISVLQQRYYSDNISLIDYDQVINSIHKPPLLLACSTFLFNCVFRV